MTRSSSSALRRYVCREPLRLLLGSAVLPPTNGRPRRPLARRRPSPSGVFIVPGADIRTFQGTAEDGRDDSEQKKQSAPSEDTARKAANGRRT